MKLWIDDEFLEVTFDKGLRLYFKLFNNDLTYRWIDLVKTCDNNEDYKINSNFLKIFSKKEIEMKFELMCDNISLINSVSDRQLPTIKSLNDLLSNAGLLNNLHEEYEIYGDNEIPLINKQMLELNDLIHFFETILEKTDISNKMCFSVVAYENYKNKLKLEKNLKYEDYFLFAADFKWGYVYLGYNTLGKGWKDLAGTNDIEVIQRKQVKPQKTFSSEYYLNFFETSPYSRKHNFYNWWNKNNFCEIYKEKFTVEDFSFGNIPLGKIEYYSIDNDVYYDADPITTINTPEAKFEWNKNIWSKQNSIIKTQFVKAFTNV